MAAKLLQSLTDDNKDLQKQIGCMTGIFQIFDRHQMITGRRINGHIPKRLPHGTSHSNSSTSETESCSIYRPQTAKEKNSHKNVNGVSTESSRPPSFSSSSRSSSFSSLDCNRIVQPEPTYMDRITFPETPARDSALNQSSSSPQFGRKSLDLRDVVKDSMYRELARGQSGKHTTMDEATHRVTKGIDEKQNLSVDLKESLKVLAKLREAPWYSDEAKEHSRSLHESKDGSFFSIPKDAPRFSYDGREINRSSFETFKSTPKLKELPRLSLDSREVSIRNFNSDSKANFLFRNSKKESGKSEEKVASLQQISETPARPPGVVAKLMGLEALPNAASTSDSQVGLIKPGLLENSNTSSIRAFNPSSNSWKEPNSPRRRNPDAVMKPISRSPIEPAPWRQLDPIRGSQKPAFKNPKGQVARSTNSFPSVYSEIEKRLKDLEFTQSGKDLRALKQILEAIQAKGPLEIKGEDRNLNFSTQRDHEPRFVGSEENVRLINQRKPLSNRGPTSSRMFESPIVIMKPRKLIEKSGIPSSSVIPTDCFLDARKVSAKNQTPKTNRKDNAISSTDKRTKSNNTRSAQSLTRPRELPKENTATSVKTSGSVSPRLQQKKLEMERCSRPPTPPSDSGKSRRQSTKQHHESGSPGGKRRPRSSKTQQISDQSSEVSSETRSLSYQEEDSKTDIEVISDLSSEINGSQRPSMEAAIYSISSSTKKKSTVKSSEDGRLAEIDSLEVEHPSPVSVLDDTLYRDDAPSPVKPIPIYVKDDGAWNSNNSGSCLTSEISRKKLENIEHLVQKLRRLNSSHDEARTDYIASLCDKSKPDNRYISEILLASGILLRDLDCFQLHQSGHPINPELFLVLEQTKFSTLSENVVHLKPDKEKFHRRLVFDAVNEILVGKLALEGSSPEPWLKPNKVAKKTLNAQKLLRELCLEIEQLQAKKPECSLEEEGDGLKSILSKDLISRSESWTDFQGEVAGVVLDVERLIFKDLVDEIVSGEAARLQGKPGRRSRQLFAK